MDMTDRKHIDGGVFCVDARNNVLIPELSHTIQSKPSGGRSLNCTPNVLYAQSVLCQNPWDPQSARIYDTGGCITP